MPPPDGLAARSRPSGTIRRANPREQGLIGLTDAIAWFGQQGWGVNLPLIDSQPYDLVVDDGRRLHRVQVKTTTHRSAAGNFVVQLCTRGGNQSFHTSKAFDPSSCDLLYVLSDDGHRYLIPSTAITARIGLSLGAKVAGFRLPRGPRTPGFAAVDTTAYPPRTPRCLGSRRDARAAKGNGL